MKLRALYPVLLLASAALPAQAEDWVLIANPRAGVTQLTRDEVINIYLGRFRYLGTGIAADPIDLSANSALRTRFYRQLVDKNPAEINAYWSRLLFSGKTRPPRVIASSDEAMHLVSRLPSALAYVERSKVNGNVMVVFEMTSKDP
jgi:ABC-type phosphate transport system substrate-binding protein